MTAALPYAALDQFALLGVRLARLLAGDAWRYAGCGPRLDRGCETVRARLKDAPQDTS